ncbi:hypothetical protein NGRA_0319 [Nosema granulosis]|uniref:Uncharacterized protein n=1 Tax=Nosema granulosis TaxID=83296 RepID=A0A9P6H149_9MICR|nr:hypothetical protein NGRA_0319 [Nosema granulosis]
MSKRFDSGFESTFLSGIARNLREKNGDFRDSKNIKSHVPSRSQREIVADVMTPPICTPPLASKHTAPLNKSSVLFNEHKNPSSGFTKMINIIYAPLRNTMTTPLINELFLDQFRQHKSPSASRLSSHKISIHTSTQTSGHSNVKLLIAKFERLGSPIQGEPTNKLKIDLNVEKDVEQIQRNVCKVSHDLHKHTLFKNTISTPKDFVDVQRQDDLNRNIQSFEDLPSEEVFEINKKIKSYEEKLKIDKNVSEPPNINTVSHINRLYSFQNLKRFFESFK